MNLGFHPSQQRHEPPRLVMPAEFAEIEYAALPGKYSILRCGPIGFGNPLAGLQIKHDSQGGVNAAHFVEIEITHAVAEATRIDCCGLFSQHPRD